MYFSYAFTICMFCFFFLLFFFYFIFSVSSSSWCLRRAVFMIVAVPGLFSYLFCGRGNHTEVSIEKNTIVS